MNNKNIIITGAAGFIGFHVSLRLKKEGYQIIAIDNLNKSYDVKIKKERLKILLKEGNHSLKFYEQDIVNKNCLRELFLKYKPSVVINLAAQAGVRNSIINPDIFIKSNILGFYNIIECCREFKVENFIYASSSSVYGNNKKIPFSEEDFVDHPVSLYAATKKSNELMAHTYSELFKIPSTGLRFFTVYGPWGRPDMAPIIFAKNIFSKKPIKVFNHGNLWRDFTYIDDIVETISRLIKKPATIDQLSRSNNSSKLINSCPHKVFNVGNGQETKLIDFISTLERIIGIKAIKDLQPMQLGDVHMTLADTSSIKDWIGFVPKTDLTFGLEKFVLWFKDFYIN